MTERDRSWRIRVAFEATRFSSEQLIKVYEQLKPTPRRETVKEASHEPATTERSGAKRGEQ